MKLRGDPLQTLHSLSQLESALIDASSILYMQKAGYFDLLVGAIKLYTIPEVILEIRSNTGGLRLIRPCGSHTLTTDKKLITCALERELAMISEDKEILRAMQRAKAPYFNALMMLNLLLLLGKIDEGRYRGYLRDLKSIARYSEIVWQFGEQVYQAGISKRFCIFSGFGLPR